MLPFAHDKDYLARWSLVEKRFCSQPNTKDGTPLLIRDYEGLKELSFVFFAGWLFCGVLNSEKDLVRPAILPMGKGGESSVLALYDWTTHLAAPARRGAFLLDRDFFVCPLDLASRPLTPTEMHLCPVVNKLRYNLAHAREGWDVSGLVEPSKTQQCCDSGKDLLWSYLADTVCKDPDLYGAMVGGTAFPINLRYEILDEYLTGVNPGTRDFGTLLEETLLWFAMARSRVMVGGAHITIEKPFKSNEIDILLYECAGNSVKAKSEPACGWPKYVENHAVCVMELTIGHQQEPDSDPGSSKRPARQTEGNDSPKNKLINFLAFKSLGFKHVEFHYVYVNQDPTLAESTKQALGFSGDFRYTFLATILGEDVGGAVLNHRDARVPVMTVRRWHDALIKAIETIGEDFARKLA